MSYTHQSNSSSPEATSARRNKTKAKLLQTLSKNIRDESTPFEQDTFTDFMARADVLAVGELRILIDFTGRTLTTRKRALEKILLHRQQNDDQPPITLGAGTGEADEWICGPCSVPDPAQPLPPVPFVGLFQKVAMHITSHHWGLKSWACPEDSCTRTYQSYDSLQRHKKKRHEDASQPNASPIPFAAPGATDTASPQLQSSIEANPELSASASDHVPDAVDWSSQGRPPAQPPFGDTLSHAQAPFVRDELSVPPLLLTPYPFVQTGARYVQVNATVPPGNQHHDLEGDITQWDMPGYSSTGPIFGPSSASASNTVGRSEANWVHPNHTSRSYPPMNEMQPEMPRMSPSLGRFGTQHFTGLTDEGWSWP